MKVQNWIFTVRYWQQQGPLPSIDRWAVVGPARASTVEAALHLANVPEEARVEIRGHAVVRDFVDDRLDPDKNGYYVDGASTILQGPSAWVVCIGSVHEVFDR